MQARNLFDDVDFALYVQTPGWDGHGELVAVVPFCCELEAKARENAQNFFHAEGFAQDAVYF